MEKKKKIILIISLATLLFGALGFTAFATNSGEAWNTNVAQTIKVSSIEMLTTQDIGLAYLYTMPTGALIDDRATTINNNIAGGGAMTVRASTRITAPTNSFRKWTTECTWQYLSEEVESITFNIGDFIFDQNARDISYDNTKYPTFKLDKMDGATSIDIFTEYSVTGYSALAERWLTVSTTDLWTQTRNFDEPTRLLKLNPIYNIINTYRMEPEVMISNIRVQVSPKDVNEYGTSIPYLLRDFEYTTYTSEEATTVEEWLSKVGESQNVMPESESFWDWLVESVESVMDIHIFKSFTIGDLFYAIIGIAIVLIFIKIFAGG